MKEEQYKLLVSQIASLIYGEKDLIAVLDIDSAQLATFDDIDRKYLEEICKMLY